MATKPVILIITGAWHVPAHYARLSNRLRHMDYRVECPLLKTNNNARPPIFTLDDDIEDVRRVAIGILSENQDIIAIMHSYGGMVGSSALAGLNQNCERGFGRVKDLIYIAAFLPFEHESLAAIFGGVLPPWLMPNDEGLINISEPGQHFYNDLPETDQRECIDGLVVHPTIAQFDGPKEIVKEAAWRTTPATYLLCRNDQALPLAVQEMMINRLEKAQQGLSIRQVYCDAGHSPFLSTPEKIIDLIEGV